MTDPFDYESRFEARLVAHAARATRPFDAAAIATAVAAGAPRRASSLPLLRSAGGGAFATIGTALVLMGLLGALIGAMLLSGGRSPFPAVVAPPLSSTIEASATPEASTDTPSTQPTVPAPSPTPAATPGTSYGLLVVSGPLTTGDRLPCEDVDRYDIDTAGSRRIIECADRVSITADGTRAAIGGDHGVAIIDLGDGRQTNFIETGEHTYPIAWSPRGTWLEWNLCGPKKVSRCQVEVGTPDGTVRNPLPLGGNGGYTCCVIWLPDESRMYMPGTAQDQVIVANGDGSALATSNDPMAFVYTNMGEVETKTAMSPDGSSFVYPHGTAVVNGLVEDAWVASVDGGSGRDLTNLVPGELGIFAPAWSPDGRTIALIKTYGRRGSSQSVPQPGAKPPELWLFDVDGGSSRRLDLPGALQSSVAFAMDPSSVAQSLRIHWSPDGSRIAVETGNASPETSIDTYIVPLDGSPGAVLKDARYAQWSRDGRVIAFVGTTGPSSYLEDQKRPPATIDVANADGSDRRVLVSPKGDPDSFWFIWAAR
jgi:hypothetical protein